MFKHVVMWSLKETDQIEKMEQAFNIKSDLEALTQFIDGVIKIEVGIDILGTKQSYDVVLISEFESKEAFDKYAVDPRHLEVVDYIKTVVDKRIAVDYEK